MVEDFELRKILFQGGGCDGKVAITTQDVVYVIEKPQETAPEHPTIRVDSAAALPGGFRVAKRFNATGRFEAVGPEDYEVYEYVGDESFGVYIRSTETK
jgi:hypothetical protein